MIKNKKQPKVGQTIWIPSLRRGIRVPVAYRITKVTKTLIYYKVDTSNRKGFTMRHIFEECFNKPGMALAGFFSTYRRCKVASDLENNWLSKAIHDLTIDNRDFFNIWTTST